MNDLELQIVQFERARGASNASIQGLFVGQIVRIVAEHSRAILKLGQEKDVSDKYAKEMLRLCRRYGECIQS